MSMIRIPLVVLILLLVFSLGCSRGGSPAAPETNGMEKGALDSSHYTWGVFTFICDPVSSSIDIVTMREATLHLNALPFLEPPPLGLLTIESLEFNGNIADVDIGLTHPFLGLTEFTGFDVCGIMFSHGSVDGFHDPELAIAGEGDTRLLNADGYSRWWNPAEFPHGDTIFTYVEGLLGTPSGPADFNTTLNGYKYFTDGLSKDDPLELIDPTSRGVFSAGQKRVRHYSIDLSGGLIFNYAIDACWESPAGNPPWTAPDDFGPNANRPEAWRISVTEVENTLYYEESTGDAGGDLQLLIDVYDWFNASDNQVSVESLSGLPYTTSAVAVDGGIGFSTYQLDLSGDSIIESGSVDLLITVESEVTGYGGLLPGKPVCVYFIHSVEVEGVEPIEPSLTLTIPNGGEVWGIGMQYDITWSSIGEITDVKLEYSKDEFIGDINEIVSSTGNDGIFEWTVPDDPSTTVKVRVSEVGDPSVFDISDDVFTISDQWSLVFPDPPVQISDSTWQDSNNRGPSVIENGSGDIVVAWSKIPASMLGGRPVDRISHNQGVSWDPLDSYPVLYYAGQDGYMTGSKMALDGIGDAYALNMWVDNDYDAFWWNYLIRCPIQDDDDWGWQMSSSFRGVELIFTTDGYAVCFEDWDVWFGEQEIWVNKGQYQNSPLGMISGNPNNSWYHQSYFQVAEYPALISTGPSVVRDTSGSIWLAYQNGTDPDEIRIVNNSNGNGTSWNYYSPLTVAEATSPDLQCLDPTLWLDSNGDMYLGYIMCTTGSPNTYSFKYMLSTTGDPDDFGTGETAMSGMTEMEYPTIQVAELPIGMATTIISKTEDGIFCAWRSPESSTWSEPIQVDSNDIGTEPSMWISQDELYVHCVWAEQDTYGKYQIWYRRGEFTGQ